MSGYDGNTCLGCGTDVSKSKHADGCTVFKETLQRARATVALVSPSESNCADLTRRRLAAKLVSMKSTDVIGTGDDPYYVGWNEACDEVLAWLGRGCEDAPR